MEPKKASGKPVVGGGVGESCTHEWKKREKKRERKIKKKNTLFVGRDTKPTAGYLEALLAKLSGSFFPCIRTPRTFPSSTRFVSSPPTCKPYSNNT